MRTISHRELRNNSGEILRDVKAGEMIEITNRGETVAILIPPSVSPYDRLVAAGKVRVATAGPDVLTNIKRRRSALTTAEILADVRGDR